MTATELGFLLLCCDLGDDALRPLTPAALRNLGSRVRSQTPSSQNPDADVQLEDLLRMGCPPKQAAQILALLSRETALKQALHQAAMRNIFPITRLSDDYPAQLRRQLGENCPPVLFCSGNTLLLNTPCISLVGSRKLNRLGRQFAARVGKLAAKEGMTLVSGNASGADQSAQTACLDAGGCVIAFVADELTRHRGTSRLLYCSEGGFQLPFSAQRALHRNCLIHCMGDKVLVAQSNYGAGGTWKGTVENLKAGWTPVFVCDDDSPGARGLAERGATPVALEQLQSLQQLEPLQRRLF